MPSSANTSSEPGWWSICRMGYTFVRSARLAQRPDALEPCSSTDAFAFDRLHGFSTAVVAGPQALAMHAVVLGASAANSKIGPREGVIVNALSGCRPQLHESRTCFAKRVPGVHHGRIRLEANPGMEL